MKLVVNYFLTINSLILLSGCISHTVLKSTDADATIKVLNFENQEKGRLDYKDRQPIWGGADIVIQKEGCKPQKYRINKTDEFSPEGFFIGFITYGFGFFWIGTYLPNYTLDFKCEKPLTVVSP